MKISSHLGMAALWFPSEATGGRRERKFCRFVLECPVSMKCQADDSTTEVQAIVRNVCIGGFSATIAAMIPQHTAVTFIISLKGEVSARPIYLTGKGEVVSVEKSRDDATFAIAVECRNPITPLEECCRHS
jgi:hypothetical protein